MLKIPGERLGVVEGNEAWRRYQGEGGGGWGKGGRREMWGAWGGLKGGGDPRKEEKLLS